MSGPTRATAGGRAYRDLQNLARADGRSTEELLALYVLEGFLARLSRCDRSQDLVLKGGALLAAYGTRRPTRDVDLSARAVSNDEGTVLDLVREIAALAGDDGIDYDVDGASAETIRDGDEYSGVRVTLWCSVATARLRFHVDVNVGDPIWPVPGQVEVPRLLGGSITVLGYPLTMVLAEKLVTAIERGTANTRWRDDADVYLLTGERSVDGTELERSLQKVAEHRGADVVPLSVVLEGYAAIGQARWAAWVRKLRLGDRLPSRFADVLDAVEAFAAPALQARASRLVWQPGSRSWDNG